MEDIKQIEKLAFDCVKKETQKALNEHKLPKMLACVSCGLNLDLIKIDNKIFCVDCFNIEFGTNHTREEFKPNY